MKVVVCLFAILITSAANAKTTIEVTEPAFTAEKVELNPITNTYVVVNPKYFVNARDAVKVVSNGLTIQVWKTAQHLCTFLGMTGGKVISTSSINHYRCNGTTLTIEDSGLYGSTHYASSYSDCDVIDYLECSPK